MRTYPTEIRLTGAALDKAVAEAEARLAISESDPGYGFSESDPNYWADYGFDVGVYPMGNDYED
jgi:hypothetical protein